MVFTDTAEVIDEHDAWSVDEDVIESLDRAWEAGSSGTRDGDAPTPREHTGHWRRETHTTDGEPMAPDVEDEDVQDFVDDLFETTEKPSAIEGVPVAEHDRGGLLYIARVSAGWVVSIVQDIEADGMTASVVTTSELAETGREAAEMWQHVATAYTSYDEEVAGFAMVGHDGNLESIDLDADPLSKSFVDIFCVRRAKLHDDLSIEDVRNARDVLVKNAYGMETDIPEEMRVNEVQSSTMAEPLPIEVFTVPATDVSRNES
jgi:hypothetical protein